MKLRDRMMLVMGATFMCLVLVVFTVSKSVLGNSYAELERTQTQKNVERARSAVQAIAKNLHQETQDWANWDDAYQFVQNRNAPFIESNLYALDDGTNSITFLDLKGNVLYSKSAEAVPEEPKVDGALISRELGIGKEVQEPFAFMTLAVHQGHVIAVSVRPVVNTARTLPPRGYVMFTRYVNQTRIKDISQGLRLAVSLLTVENFDSNQLTQSASKELRAGARSVAAPYTDRQMHGYGYLRDYRGNPVGVVKVSEFRSVYSQGVTSQMLLLQNMIFGLVVISIVILVSVEVFGLARIRSLTNQIEAIVCTSPGERRVDLPGKDELSWLAGKVNSMLDALNASELQLRTYNESLEQQVQERTQELQTRTEALEHAVNGIAFIDQHGYFQNVNNAVLNIVRLPQTDVLGAQWSTMVIPEHQLHVRAAMDEAVRLGRSEIECSIRTGDNEEVFVELTLVSAKNTSGKQAGFHLFMKDITQRKQLERQIEYQAFHDDLTGMPNRLLFIDRLQVAIDRLARHQSTAAVIFLDLDNFKVINDSLGHEAGDELLKQISERLRSGLRPGETASRWGGDEFTVLLEELTDEEEARQRASSIAEMMRGRFQLAQGDVFVSASVGLRVVTASDADFASLLRDADTAMYQAKANGRDELVLFDPSMNARANERLEIENGLRNALVHQEFYLNYQPLVDLQNGRLIGVEALVRWQHPTQGVIPPNVFIPIAEETGLIMPLGYWVLEEACKQAKSWIEAFGCNDLVINVNLSGRQLLRSNVTEKVAEVLQSTGLEAHHLKLEITESIFVSNTENITRTLNELKALGVKLAIDDFGTGYSSISSLSSLPVDTVKIDRAFVKDLGKSAEADGVIGAILMLANSMNLDVTAEGLESLDQVKRVTELGCEIGQGYYFAKPLRQEQIEAMLKLDAEDRAA